MNNAVFLASSWDDKIPSNQVFTLSKTLENIDESSIAALSALPLKSPILGLILGLFFGMLGVDRFYKGDIGLGVVKLILTLTVFGMFISAIWVVLDWFLVYFGIKKDNFVKITQVLALANKKQN